MIKKVINTVSWIYVISDLNDEEIVETFYKIKLKKQIKLKKSNKEKRR